MTPFFADESERARLFPVCRSKIFLGHAAVTALPACVADAMCAHIRQSCEMPQEFGAVLRDIKGARAVCAQFIGAEPEEIALLGPTSLGLSLFANGLPWQAGDEVACYAGDYPANVYPWLELRRRGVVVRLLQPERPGEITPALVEAALTPRTRLVALASCHFFGGYRIDVDAIGRMLHGRGVLFSLDAIQTLGAFPLSVEHVDFLSADAHKWMLGPVAIGIVYVKKRHFELCRPTLLGAWNVYSPNFHAQDEVRFMPTAQRYEPGVLNIAGIYGMKAALEMFLRIGPERIAGRILELTAFLAAALRDRGYELHSPAAGATASGITTFRHPQRNMAELHAKLDHAGVVCSLRHDREGREYLRLSPHFYNTESELTAVLGHL
ncbi:MAG: aminotransferase class V-fold PLP-dependent enzyme [Chthoniobacteraceae bacterium]